MLEGGRKHSHLACHFVPAFPSPAPWPSSVCFHIWSLDCFLTFFLLLSLSATAGHDVSGHAAAAAAAGRDPTAVRGFPSPSPAALNVGRRCLHADTTAADNPTAADKLPAAAQHPERYAAPAAPPGAPVRATLLLALLSRLSMRCIDLHRVEQPDR